MSKRNRRKLKEEEEDWGEEDWDDMKIENLESFTGELEGYQVVGRYRTKLQAQVAVLLMAVYGYMKSLWEMVREVSAPRSGR